MKSVKSVKSEERDRSTQIVERLGGRDDQAPTSIARNPVAISAVQSFASCVLSHRLASVYVIEGEKSVDTQRPRLPLEQSRMLNAHDPRPRGDLPCENLN